MVQISKENEISPDKAPDKIKEWKMRIEIPKIDELMNFDFAGNKSSISFGYWAEGHRVTQIMKISRLRMMMMMAVVVGETIMNFPL